MSFFVGEGTDALIILADHLPQRRARILQRVPLRARGRGAALSACATWRSCMRDGRRQRGRRDRARARRRRPDRGRRRGAGRSAAAARRRGSSATRRCSPASRCRPRSRPSRSTRPSRRWISPPARSWARSCARAAGSAWWCGPGRHRVRGDRAAARRAPAADGIPARPADFSLLLVRVTAVLAGSILVINLALGRPVLDVGAVRARDRRRADPAAAAGDRHDQPLDRRQAAGRARGDREAARQHRGPRQHRGAVHRQDRHADRGHRSRFAAALDAAVSALGGGPASRPALQRRGRSPTDGSSAATSSTGRSGTRRAPAAPAPSDCRRLAERPVRLRAAARLGARRGSRWHAASRSSRARPRRCSPAARPSTCEPEAGARAPVRSRQPRDRGRHARRRRLGRR